MNDTPIWYYVGSFGQIGPLTRPQLEELIESGVIEGSTFVWKQGMTDWLPASSVIELDSAFRAAPSYAAPPPLPTQPVLSNHPGMAGSRPGANAPVVPNFYNAMPASTIRSDKNRTVAGILNLFIPGAGRMYLGYTALGVLQLVLCMFSCGALWLWSAIDGILILSGQLRLDGYGRSLED